MTGKNPTLDIVNIIANTKFSQFLFIVYQDIKRKRILRGVMGHNSITNLVKLC